MYGFPFIEKEQLEKTFDLNATIIQIEPFGTGHINDTFRVYTDDAHKDDFLLQRINTGVFKDVEGLMENILRVTRHLKSKLIEQGYQEPERETITLIPTRQNKWYYIDEQGHAWRMQKHIPGSIAFEIVEESHQAREAGKAFGIFQSLLEDMPGPPLHHTIPYFHHVGRRVEKLRQVMKADPLNRLKDVQRDVDFILARAEEMQTIEKSGEAGNIPARITHNDTKVNNVLFDEKSRQALCVIDLDTVMPGYIHYDFGDAVRTICNTGAEDEPHIENVRFQSGFFKAFAEGFLTQTVHVITPEEKKYLVQSARLMTFLMGMRFLTDYIEGDVYYKINDPLQNLRRTRSQQKLIREMEGHASMMEEIVDDIIESRSSTVRPFNRPS